MAGASLAEATATDGESSRAYAREPAAALDGARPGIGEAEEAAIAPAPAPSTDAPEAGELPPTAALAIDRPLHDGLGEAFRGGKIITGATPRRLILFTFDDGPDRRTTPLLLDRLDAEGIHAVFFLVGERLGSDTPRLRQQSAIAREIVERGHLVGNHTVNHVQLPALETEVALREVLGAQHTFEDVFGGRPWLIRPPFGAHSQRIDQHLAAHDYTIVLWNLGAGDHQVRSADEVFDTWRKVFERRERDEGDRGGIILLHDTYAWSVDAFQRIVAHLRARNCELLAQGEELYDFVDDPTFFYEPRADALAEAVAAPADPHPEILEARQAQLRELTAQRCRSIPTP